MSYMGQPEVPPSEKENKENEDTTGAITQLITLIAIPCICVLSLFTFRVLVYFSRR